MAKSDRFVIAQFSDVHCGDARFDEKLMLKLVAEVNELEPDLVLVPGDLTASGYREQFEEFVRYADLIECTHRVVIAGNHDCRNVGWEIFEEVVGPRQTIATYEGLPGGESLTLFAADSNIPDLNDGELGRNKLNAIRKDLGGADGFKLFMLHHHLVSIPGTGRERNVVWDAGDVLAALQEVGCDLVLAGHKHVPFVWPLAGMTIVTSGTGASLRTRGYAPPSYNVIGIGAAEIDVTIRETATGAEKRHRVPRRAREAG
jgi:3',5'-cyclic AMP phosphodiesterase CpdA